MRRLFYTLCLTVFIAFCSCQQQVPERDDSLPPVQQNSISVFPAPTDSPVVSSKNIEQQAASKPKATVLNPEHGQPGHRCDIAVGAPLNSPSTIQPAPTAVTASPAPIISLPANTDASVSLNPPHGQPGHDCAIPVGQPLKG